ncbi:MAG: lipid-A-disaccharide synthase [Betaproteobacteria bacterium HGW-Betaproteobacteria-2]|jgi:lipid-A-disaccharide synthase|nr:MAG: lipid-A-disaccharide synthase [Betaproteobacteria bacterium HGW-Betaproteobacteria-2]PKO91689.1 MAG: lipid-A-disaccharide synthase [Betaproteobacteria bacterium HGW-Betaproteobacteria-1]
MPIIGIVAGEASGDLLGSHLIRALKKRRPDLEFVGIAGPKMMAEGAKTLFPMERLSVRGFVEVIRHLPGLLKLRKQLAQHFLQNPPDLFIGIDAPDFNFALERKLKQHGIRTIHYVSPSIWAWRKGRIRKIKAAVSHMLALFPFEPAIYQAADIPVSYVGHPLADILPLESSMREAREDLKLQNANQVIAMLPGSRQSEVRQLARLYVRTARLMLNKQPSLKFLIPLVTKETREIFQQAIYDDNAQDLPLQILFGHAHLAMQAADAIIVASGTATLEAALIKRPMVITYRMPRLSWMLLKRMNYLPYVGLPNILANRFVVPELLQHDANPEKLAETTLHLIEDKNLMAEIREEFTRMHLTLRQNTEEKAADAILAYL